MGSSPLHIALPDGRTLFGRTSGPADGRPVLFVAGAGTGSAMGFGDEWLTELGVRLLSMDRPGMGASSADPARTAESTARDYAAFVHAASGVPSLPVVANSQGSVFGVALAVAGVAERLVLASPADEVARPAVRDALSPEARLLPDLVAADPDGARRLLSGFTAEAMERFVLDGSDPEDRAAYSSPEFAARYRRALAEGFAREGAGYVADTLIALAPWEPGPERIAVPTTILLGARDRSHAPEGGRLLAARIPGARRVELGDAGGALLWTHSRRVLDAALGVPVSG